MAIRDALRSALEPDLFVRVASPTAILACEGDDYAVVNLETPLRSGREELILYLNYGTGSFLWLERRGFEGKKPRSMADCLHRLRHLPDPGRIASDVFSDIHIRPETWDDPAGRAAILSDFRDVAAREILPWVRAKWAA